MELNWISSNFLTGYLRLVQKASVPTTVFTKIKRKEIRKFTSRRVQRLKQLWMEANKKQIGDFTY